MAGTEHQVRLTPRERQIVQAVLDGCTNVEIAGRLHLREQTVRNALSVIYEKFHVNNRLKLAREASRSGDW